MPIYDVETDLLVSVKIKVRVEAPSPREAVDAATELLPQNYNSDSSNQWRAAISLRPPKTVSIVSAKPYHFQQASGTDKARLVKSSCAT